MSVKVKFKIGEKKGITAKYTVKNDNPIRTVFKLNVPSVAFSTLIGSPYDNANLKDALDLKADKSELESDMAAVDEAISNVQTVVENNYNTLDNKIDNVNSELSGDISTLENTVNSNNTAVNNRIDATNQTVAELSTTVADNNTAINNRVDGIVESFDGDISNLETAIQNEAATRANNDTLLQGDINTLQTDLTAEISNRTSADNTLQDNIDTLASDLADETTARENADTTLQGNINTLSDTVDANDTAINNKVDSINTTLTDSINGLSDTVASNYNTLDVRITANSDDIATNTGNINTLSNTVTSNFNTLDGKITTLSGTVSSNYNTLDTKIDNTKSAIDSDISDLSDTVNQNYTDLNNAITTSASTINSRIDTEVNTLNTAIATENTQRQAADSNLQSQIDAITSASDVFDIVGTYAELQTYDIVTVPPNDIIKVLVDSTHNNAATYYRCVENDGVKSWTYIGSEGAYYTKSEADNAFVAKTTTINNKPLSSNITLTASDVNALPADTVIGSGVITLQKNGVNIDSFNVNATANKSINISVPTDTSELTNNAGYITGINQADVLDALGFTPYNASNPDGFITSADLPTNYVTTDTAQDISGRKTFLGEKAIYFKQVTTSNKLGFTLYNPSNGELAALEYRPNAINGASLLALNCPQTTGGYVGFRYWGSPAVNIVAPKVATAGNYFMATHITNGTLTVTADNQGTVNISTLLPDVSGFATQAWVQNQNYITSAALNDYVTNTSLATTLADYVTNSALATTLADYALTSDIPTKTSDLTNDSNFATVSQIPTNNNQLTNGAGYITNSALSGYATENFVTSQGYITGITSSDVTTALGFTPYNSTNPAGYITASAIGNGTVTINQGGTQKGTFTLNQSGNVTIDLDAGGASNLVDLSDVSITSATSGDVLSFDGSDWINTNGFIKNIATGTGAISFGNNAIAGTATQSINIGAASKATKNHSIAIGGNAKATALGAIQIGIGTNSTACSLNIGGYKTGAVQYNWQLLDCETGLIPDARLSSNIARTSQLPSAVTETTVSGWGFTKNSGTVTSVNNVSPVNGNVTLSIPAAQVQADWNVTNTSSMAYIKNKPTIPAAVTVDTTLSTTSTNPVQNKVITTELNKKIEGITSSDVTTALGYTPYNSTNPNGYITASALKGYAKTADLATVATSGSYNDLDDKPTIPAAQVQADWNATSGVAQILNKPTNYVTTDTAQSISGQKTFTSTIKSSVGNSLALTLSTGDAFGVTVKRTDANNEIKFGIGQGGDNRGIWDARHNTWAFHVTNDGKSYTLGNEIAIKSDLDSLSPLRYSRYSIASANSTNKFIKLASMTHTQSGNRDFSYLFWVEILDANINKCYALVKLSARWSNTSYTGHKFEILEKYGDLAASLEIFKNLTYAYSLDTTTHKMTAEIWLEIKDASWVSYYLRPTECNEYGDYSSTPVTLSNNVWTYYNQSGNASSIASTAITSGLTQVKVTDATGVRNENNLSQVMKMWAGTKAEYDAIVTKDANTLYNVEGVGLYKGTTLISNDGANKDLSNLSSTGNSKFQTPLVSGTNIKTINNTSLLGSGNIDTSEIFVAEYNVTTFQQVSNAYSAGKTIVCKLSGFRCLTIVYDPTFRQFVFSGVLTDNLSDIKNLLLYYIILNSSDNWSIVQKQLADTDLSNLSTTGQAVIDGKVSKSGDTMTGALNFKASDIELGVIPTENTFSRALYIRDKNDVDIAQVYYRQGSDNTQRLTFKVVSNNGTDATYAYIGYDQNGNTDCGFPHTDRVDGQWVKKSATLATNVTWKTNTAAKTYSLSSYLPNDGYSYEVLFSGVAVTGTTSGNFVTIQLSTTFVDDVSVCEARTRTASAMEAQGNAILPIGSNRAVTQYSSSSANANGTYSLYVKAYRRIGTNS